MPDGLRVVKTLTFTGSGYVFDLGLNVSGSTKVKGLGVAMTQPMKPRPGSYYNTPVVQADVKGKVLADEEKSIKKPVSMSGLITYAGFGDRYFLTAFLPKTPDNGVLTTHLKGDDATARLMFPGVSHIETQVFAGPKALQVLDAINPKLHEAIDFGWFSFLSLPFLRILEFFHDFAPNWGWDIILITIGIRLLTLPMSIKGTRSMMKMQLLSPEMKKLQAKYKSPPGTPPAERNANRQALNEEMMALYKENGVSPTGGCLPMFLQFPIFLILYGTIEGLTHTTKAGLADPLYISHSSRMYHDIIAAHGKLMAFGLNLGDNALTHGLSAWGRAPYIGLILVALVLQYIQLKQMSGRNPAAQQANPQMQQMQKVMPLIFAVIYIRISAGVNIYFVVSSLFRIAQQEYMYRHDPDLRGSLEKLRARPAEDPKVAEAKKKISAERGKGGLLSRFLPAAALTSGEAPARESQKNQGPAKPKGQGPTKGQGQAKGRGQNQPTRQEPGRGGDGGASGRPPRPSGSGGASGRPRPGSGAAAGARPTRSSSQAGSGQRNPGRSQPRPQGKRQRRPR